MINGSLLKLELFVVALSFCSPGERPRASHYLVAPFSTRTFLSLFFFICIFYIYISIVTHRTLPSIFLSALCLFRFFFALTCARFLLLLSSIFSSFCSLRLITTLFSELLMGWSLNCLRTLDYYASWLLCYNTGLCYYSFYYLAIYRVSE